MSYRSATRWVNFDIIASISLEITACWSKVVQPSKAWIRSFMSNNKFDRKKHRTENSLYVLVYVVKGVRVKVDRYYAIGSWPASRNRPPLARSAFCHPPSWRTSGVRGWLSLSTNPRATRLSRIINMTVHPLKEDGRRRVSVVLRRACISISATIPSSTSSRCTIFYKS